MESEIQENHAHKRKRHRPGQAGRANAGGDRRASPRRRRGYGIRKSGSHWRDCPVFEPRLRRLSFWLRTIDATQNIEDAVRDTDITFIVVATPADADGTFSLRYALPFARRLAAHSRPKRNITGCDDQHGDAGFHDGPCVKPLNGQRKARGVDFGLCYSPEFIALEA